MLVTFSINLIMIMVRQRYKSFLCAFQNDCLWMTVFFKCFYKVFCSKEVETSTQEGAAESVDPARSGHEDTCFLVEIPQRGLFMSCRGDSGLCTVVSQEGLHFRQGLCVSLCSGPCFAKSGPCGVPVNHLTQTRVVKTALY